jgi:prepilin-type N-terminal cleavage/methylation domain-containing protein
MKRWNGFTIIELLVVIMVISILVGIVIIGYESWQQRVADTSVKSDILQASAGLKSYKNFQNTYPPNLAGTGFAPSKNVGLVLYTDAASIGVYQSLSPDENAQLFLNSCNANLQNTNSTSCSFAGSGNGAKIHVKGTNSTNAIWNIPIQQSDVVLNCGIVCSNATNTMIQQFLAQGGTFPINGTGNTAQLPEPTKVPNGPASKYCLEGRSGSYPQIVFYSLSNEPKIQSGACPSDPELHYYQ